MGQFFSVDLCDLEEASRCSDFEKCVQILDKRPDLNPFIPVFTRVNKKYALNAVKYVESFLLPIQPPEIRSGQTLEIDMLKKVTRGFAWLFKDEKTRVLPLQIEVTRDSSLFSVTPTTAQIAQAPFAWAIDHLHPDLIRLFLGTPHLLSPIAIVPLDAFPPIDGRGCVGLRPLSYWIALHLCPHLHSDRVLDRIDEVCALLVQAEHSRWSNRTTVSSRSSRTGNENWYFCPATKRTFLQLAIFYENYYRNNQCAEHSRVWCQRHKRIVQAESVRCRMIENEWTSPMASAQKWKQRRLVEMLLDVVDWAATDEEGGNVLHHAVKYGSVEMLGMIINHSKLKYNKLLLKTRDESGKTPLALAVETDFDKAHLLIGAGAEYRDQLGFLFQMKDQSIKVLQLIDLLERKRVWSPKSP